MLEGNLGDFTLSDVLRLLAFTSKTGRLRMHRDGVEAQVVLRDGHVVEASTDVTRLAVTRRVTGAGAVSPEALTGVLDRTGSSTDDGEIMATLVHEGAVDSGAAAEAAHASAVDAVGELLRWGEGSFAFEAAEDVGHLARLPGVGMAVDDLLGLAEARVGRAAQLAAQLGDGDATVSLVAPPSPRELTLGPDAWSLVTLFDGSRTIRELADLSGRGELGLREAVAELAELGIVSVGPRGSSATAELDAVFARLSDLEGSASPAVSRPATGAGADTPAQTGRATPAAGAPSRPAVQAARPSVPGTSPGRPATIGGTGDTSRPSQPAGAGRRPAAAPGPVPVDRIGSELRAAMEDLDALNGMPEPDPDAVSSRPHAPHLTRAEESEREARARDGDGPVGPPPLARTRARGASPNASEPAATPRVTTFELDTDGRPTGAEAAGTPRSVPGRRLTLDPSIDEELVDQLARRVEEL